MTRRLAWEFDSPTGTYRNPVLSARFRTWIRDHCVMYAHARLVNGTSRRPHDPITIQAISQLPPPEPLQECVRLVEADCRTTTIKADEWGGTVPYRSFEEDLSRFDPENPVQNRLLDLGVMIRDGLVARSLRSTLAKWVPGRGTLIEDGVLIRQAWFGLRAAIAATLGLDNRIGIKSKRTPSVADYAAVSDLLGPSYYGAPTVGEGCYYLAFVGRKAADVLRESPEFESLSGYSDTHPPYKGEIGRLWWDNRAAIRFIEIFRSHLVGSGDAIVIGDEAVAVAECQPLELRAAAPTDFGRSKAVALYGIAAAGLIFPRAVRGECRVIHITEGPDIDPFGVQLRDNLRLRWSTFKMRQRRRFIEPAKTGLGFFLRYLANKVDGAGYFYTEEDESDDD